MPMNNIVLVHGAWADGSSWSKIVPLLQAKGLNVACTQNPLTKRIFPLLSAPTTFTMDKY